MPLRAPSRKAMPYWPPEQRYTVAMGAVSGPLPGCGVRITATDSGVSSWLSDYGTDTHVQT